MESPSFKARGMELAHGKHWLSYLCLLPQCLEQYLVNEWMNNEWMNNHEWINEGVAKLQEGMTHTGAHTDSSFHKIT